MKGPTMTTEEQLSPEVCELVCLAAAIGRNCRFSFERHYAEALHRNIPGHHIQAVIDLAHKVRRISDQEMDSTILNKLSVANPEFTRTATHQAADAYR